MAEAGPARANPHRSHWLGRALLGLVKRLLSLRYRIEVSGLSAVRARGTDQIVFLPNHPALVDPILILALLYKDFAPRSLADEVQMDRPFIRRLAGLFGARRLPNLARRGLTGVEGTRQALTESVAGLAAGECLLLYPSGRLKRERLERIGAASAAEVIVKAAPQARVVLVRQNGLWGSSLSHGPAGVMPRVTPFLLRAVACLLLNGVFFIPRRRLTFEFVEPADFPRDAGRMALNRYLEDFYNANAAPNTYVPYFFWERGGVRELPEPRRWRPADAAGSAPSATTQLVFERLTEATGRRDLRSDHLLAQDLGLDSLAVADLALWLEREFGHPVGAPESLETVGDVVLAATGRGLGALDVDLQPPGRRWSAAAPTGRPLAAPAGETIAEVFLRQARRGPDRVIVADRTSGERSYRELIAGLLALQPALSRLPGAHLGIMLPASVGAATLYLATIFAGKTPVMVNWTTGARNLMHGLEVVGVERVLTARTLLERLRTQGVDLSRLADRFVFVEDLRRGLTLGQRLRAKLLSYVSWRRLWRAPIAEVAVVLFTSGSESLPKAVPLTHRNILTNVRDVPAVGELWATDAMIGLLPPFHSFGLTVGIVLPLCSGLRTVYHPNPTERATLARVVEAYRVTLLVGTPTFLNGIVRAARPEQLATLRLAITGAESCPEELYQALQTRCPQLAVLEGYGVTECSPVVSVNAFEAPVRFSIGRLLPSVEGALVDPETGGRVARGAAGLLLLRGPSVFSGYVGHGGESPFVEFEGRTWYRTGDLVTQNADGVLFFRGRLKRFVKLGGEMIALPAIEAVLAPHFAAADDDGPTFAVEALGSPDNPELVLFATRQVERTEVNDWLRAAGLSPLHFVRQVIQVAAIPVLGTGKTDHRSLKERHAAAAGR